MLRANYDIPVATRVAKATYLKFEQVAKSKSLRIAEALREAIDLYVKKNTGVEAEAASTPVSGESHVSSVAQKGGRMARRP